MSTLVQRELFEEHRAEQGRYRDVESDAAHGDPSEKVFDDEDRWRVYEVGE
jgi:hypothetical protein